MPSMLGIDNSIICTTAFVECTRTHSRTHSPRPHTLYQPLRGNLSSSTVSSSARSLFLLMNQLISNDFSTNFCDSRINIAEQCLWDWNFWQSAIPQRSRVQSVSTAHGWCVDKTLSLKPKREGETILQPTLNKKRTNTLHCDMPANSPKPCLHRS